MSDTRVSSSGLDEMLVSSGTQHGPFFFVEGYFNLHIHKESYRKFSGSL